MSVSTEVLMTTLQLPDAADYKSQMAMHTSTANTGISFAREFQKHLSDPTWAHGLLNHGNYRKHASKQKLNNCAYNVQEIQDTPQISVKMTCETTKFPELSFCSPHEKPRRVRGMCKNHHLEL